MAAEIQETLKQAAEKIGGFAANAATMTVETWYIEIGVDEVPIDDKGEADFRKHAHPIAMTEVRLDGDCIAVLPMRKGEGGAFEVDDELMDLHERNVKVAADYRASILNAVAGILKEAI